MLYCQLPPGESVESGKAVAVFYPDDKLRVKALVPEGALPEISLKDAVYISGQYQETSDEPILGTVEKISLIPEKFDSVDASFESYYAVYIIVSDTGKLRYGMNVTVTNQISQPDL